MVAVPKKHHVDRRAAQLAAALDDGKDEVLTPVQAAAFLGCSIQFLAIGRVKGYGPRYAKPSPRMVRYFKSWLIEWLRERSHASTAEYRRGREEGVT